MAIDFATPLGQVRLLINDVDETSLVFQDAEIQAFLAIEGDSVKRAAAQAIDSQATNEALAAKVIRDSKVATNGAALADAMRKHAAALRDQADVEDDGGFFDIIDFDPYPPREL